MSKPIIILGGGGHAKVLFDSMKQLSQTIVAISVPDGVCSEIKGVEIISDDNLLLDFPPSDVKLVNGVGGVTVPYARKKIFDFFKSKGYTFETVVHPSAIIASDAIISEGVQIMAGAVIQTGVSLGMNTIINTRAIVDHNSCIGAHVHVAPGVTICGSVLLEDLVHVGAGATILQGMRIGAGSLVGASALVNRPVGNGVQVLGIPAKERPK